MKYQVTTTNSDTESVCDVRTSSAGVALEGYGNLLRIM